MSRLAYRRYLDHVSLGCQWISTCKLRTSACVIFLFTRYVRSKNTENMNHDVPVMPALGRQYIPLRSHRRWSLSALIDAGCSVGSADCLNRQNLPFIEFHLQCFFALPQSGLDIYLAATFRIAGHLLFFFFRKFIQHFTSTFVPLFYFIYLLDRRPSALVVFPQSSSPP